MFFQEKSWTDKQQTKLLTELLKIKGKNIFSVDKTNCDGRFCGRAFNTYLRNHCPGHISCKYIRIWGASREAFNLLSKSKQPEEPNARKRRLNDAIKTVAKQLGNTKTVSQNYYIHPTIQKVYMEGQFPFIKENLPLAKLEYKLFRFLLKHS